MSPGMNRNSPLVYVSECICEYDTGMRIYHVHIYIYGCICIGACIYVRMGVYVYVVHMYRYVCEGSIYVYEHDLV